MTHSDCRHHRRAPEHRLNSEPPPIPPWLLVDVVVGVVDVVVEVDGAAVMYNTLASLS